jgi:hypothetical protein
MDNKIMGSAHFMRNARRIDDLTEFRRDCIHKRASPRLFVVEKVIELSKIDYENFTSDLLADRQFIDENLSLMFTDGNVWHCLLAVQKGGFGMGVLIESKKMNYPMYTALYRKNIVIKPV